MRFVRVAEEPSEFDRSGLHVRLRAQQPERSEHGCQHRRFQLRARVAHEEGDLARRLAATPPHRRARHVAGVGLVEPADAIVGQPGARADRAGASFVADHAQRQIVALAIVKVALVTDVHGRASLSFVVALLREP
jgi:hypothetical protein